MNRTVLKDPVTGKSEVIYESRKTSFQHWVSIAAQILGIAVIVFAAAKFGIRAETRDAIEHEMESPVGVIHLGIEKCIAETIKPMEKNITKMETLQVIIQEDIREIKDDVKEIAANGR